jgi:hypothetical protein
MSTLEQKKYIEHKYIELELIDKNLNKILDNNCFDPNIYPNEGFTPVCRQCNLDFEEFKKSTIMDTMEVEMKHPNSCLWNEFFIKKIKTVCPYAKIVRKKNRK